MIARLILAALLVSLATPSFAQSAKSATLADTGSEQFPAPKNVLAPVNPSVQAEQQVKRQAVKSNQAIAPGTIPLSARHS